MSIYGMHHNVNVQVLRPGINVPGYATDGSAGLDLQAAEKTIIRTGLFEAVPTGLAIEIPHGFVGLLCPRSGLAVRHGVTVLNSPGIIDSDYRGEIHAPLINLGQKHYVAEQGDRVAQLLIMPVEHVYLVAVTNLAPTVRGHHGFGSTGR